MKKLFPSLFAAVLAAGSLFGQPNVVFIFIDDIGWGDISAYRNLYGFTPSTNDKEGGVITPNIDAFAAGGMLFTQGYVASPVCSPSRVGVLTGIEPCRFAIHDFLDGKAANDNRHMNDWLDPHAISSARWFQQAGYATGMFGKWHMGGGRDVNDAPFPQDYGFDESLTSFEGMGDRILYLDDGAIHGLSQQNADVPGSIEWVEWELGADKHTDAAIDFITRAVENEKPFFVFVPHDDTHAPYDTDPGKENDFDHVSGIASNTNAKLFLSELHELDKQIGRLIDTIDNLGVAEETLIVIVGDNGAPDDGVNTALNRNGDLRGGKKSIWEGGLRNPFLIRMPGTVPAGVVNHTTAVSTLDLFPTYCALAGLELPDAPLAGENMVDVFKGATRQRERALFWEFATNPGITISASSPQLAMREGDFKFIRNVDGTQRRLFNLLESAPSAGPMIPENNRQENDAANLIDEPAHAARIASMEGRLMAWYAEALLGEHEDGKRTGIAEKSLAEDGSVEFVRLFWDSIGVDWSPPEISADLEEWMPVAFAAKDAELDFGTLRWLEIPVPEGFGEKAFFRGPEEELPPVQGGTPVYLVNTAGEIRSFTGIGGGELPISDNSFASGSLEATIAGYGAYQGFTQTPDGEVYGVSGQGDVHRWNTLASWLAGDTPAVLSTGAYNPGELHGLSYDGNTGGFFVIYEGSSSSRADGALGEYATEDDFINDANALVTASIYGGNIANFYYPGEDAPGNQNAAAAGSNYFSVSGGGVMEGWLTLADYAVNKTGAGGREFAQNGYANIAGGFAEVGGESPVFFISDSGEIRRFSGVNIGATPIIGGTISDGELVATVAAYGDYQGFTQVPGVGILGVNAAGNVHSWPTLADWISGASPVVESTGAYNAGELHGLSFDGRTGGIYVVYEGDSSSRDDGDFGEYASVEDFVNDQNAVITASTFGGNILNFYYPGEDCPANRPAPNDAGGANYFQATSSGQLEGFLTLSSYAGGGGNRTYQIPGFCPSTTPAAFAIIP